MANRSDQIWSYDDPAVFLRGIPYYAYLLFESHNVDPFYVGKGTHRRVMGHLTEKRTDTNNHDKIEIIERSLRSYGYVEALIVPATTEVAARCFEFLLITEYRSRGTLTNKSMMTSKRKPRLPEPLPKVNEWVEAKLGPIIQPSLDT